MHHALTQRLQRLKSTATTLRGAIRTICGAVRPLAFPGAPMTRAQIPYSRSLPRCEYPDRPARPRDVVRMALVRGSLSRWWDSTDWHAAARWHWLGARQTEASELMERALDRRANRAARTLGVWARDEAESVAEALTHAIAVDVSVARALLTRRWQSTPAAPTSTALAIALADAYESRCMRGSLTASQRGRIIYGSGAQEDSSYPYRGSFKNWPARWHNAGARWVAEGTKLHLAIENSRGTNIATLAMPQSMRGIACGDECTHGDLYSLPRKGVRPSGFRARYAPDGRQTGVAMLMPHPETAGKHYWEHGATPAACIAVLERKIEIASAKRRAATETAREQRRLRLLARLSERITVSRQDALAVGACDAGIRGWLARVGHAEAQALPAREVVRLAAETHERQALAAAIMAARRVMQHATA